MEDDSAKKMIRKIERMAGINKVSAFDKALGTFTSQQSPFDKVLARMSKPSALDKALKTFASQQSSLDKVLAKMSEPSALDKALKTFTSQQSSFDKVLAKMAQPSAIDKALKSFTTQQASFDKALARAINPSAINNALKAFSNQQSAIEKAVQAFAASSRVILDEPNCILAMAETITDIENYGDISSEEQIEIIKRFDESSKELGEANDSQSFICIFEKLPPILKIFLFYILLSIIIPQVNSISANLLTPIVQSYLSGNDQPTREKIKDIKTLSSTVDNIVIDDLRFITGDVVHLREEPSTRSDILDEMTFGQIVTVLSKQRNWIEIMYEYENGEILYGWVYTRYTARFSK